jgi:hypothetical protein
MDRVERLGLNALPAALTDDIWAHVYVQQANSVFAGKTKPASSGFAGKMKPADSVFAGKTKSAQPPPPAPVGAGGLHEQDAATNEAALAGRSKAEPTPLHSHEHHVGTAPDEPGFAGKTKPAPPPPAAPSLTDTAAEPTLLPSHAHHVETQRGSHTHKGGTAPDEPSGEDKGSNFYGVSHFPCCITNFPQGWPKLAAHAFALLPGGGGVVVASLMPSTLTLPSSIVGDEYGAGGGSAEPHTGRHTDTRTDFAAGVTVTVGSAYPFDDEIPISVSSPAPFSLVVRIPVWASSATVNDAPATPGTLHTLHGVGGVDGVNKVMVRLLTEIRVERGWGPAGLPATVQQGLDSADTGGGSHEGPRVGSPLVPTDGDAGIDPAQGSVISPALTDVESRLGVSQLRPLEAAPVRGSPFAAHAHSEPGSRHSVETPAQAAEDALSPAPPPTLSSATPPTDGVAFTRGALVFALRPTEIVRVIKTYPSAVDGKPNDLEIGTSEAWNYAVDLGTPPRFVREASKGWSLRNPFCTKEYPFYIEVRARRLHAWGYWQGTNITDNLPPSPIDCSADGACGEVRTLRLVPYGATNIRISVFPWYNSSAQRT